MICKVEEEEVRKVVFSMDQYKALGLDGFLPTFLKEVWDIIKYDTTHVAHDFVRMGKFLKEDPQR